jgi:heme/copper-type cytochrome/quinol oxidase subunit 2
MEQMTLNRRTLGFMLIGAGAFVLAGPAVARIFAQEQSPNRREFVMKAKDYQFTPARLEVLQDDLVKVTVQSEDLAYSFTIDEYRLSKRIPAGGSTTLEFRADQAGTFAFYSNMTGQAKMRGELIVRAR